MNTIFIKKNVGQGQQELSLKCKLLLKVFRTIESSARILITRKIQHFSMSFFSVVNDTS